MHKPYQDKGSAWRPNKFLWFLGNPTSLSWLKFHKASAQQIQTTLVLLFFFSTKLVSVFVLFYYSTAVETKGLKVQISQNIPQQMIKISEVKIMIEFR